jgi:hypothetical protein
MGKILKIVLANVIITFFVVIAFDLFSYFFIPRHYVSRFEGYRYVSRPDVGGNMSYPNDYFIEHSDRGFDIGATKSGHHWVDGITYPIWSNSLGCLDREHHSSAPYVYFAGDSFTWGYVPYEQHFGTIIEESTGRTIFKCGVTNSGQRHQYAKLVDIIDMVGKMPQEIFVFYYPNDIANDYVHPHSTVIQGWLVDTVFIDKSDKLARLTRAQLEERLDKRLSEIESRKSQRDFTSRAKRTAKLYSLSANMVDYIKDNIRDAISQDHLSKVTSPIYNKNQSLRSFYYLPHERNGRFHYLHNPLAQQNKEGLLDFNRLAIENNIKFSVVLIPPKSQTENTHYYEELREFLSANDIRHIDLAQAFADRQIETMDIYWSHDQHFNLLGNKFVAEIVIEAFPDIFGSGISD